MEVLYLASVLMELCFRGAPTNVFGENKYNYWSLQFEDEEVIVSPWLLLPYLISHYHHLYATKTTTLIPNWSSLPSVSFYFFHFLFFVQYSFVLVSTRFFLEHFPSSHFLTLSQFTDSHFSRLIYSFKVSVFRFLEALLFLILFFSFYRYFALFQLLITAAFISLLQTSSLIILYHSLHSHSHFLIADLCTFSSSYYSSVFTFSQTSIFYFLNRITIFYYLLTYYRRKISIKYSFDTLPNLFPILYIFLVFAAVMAA